MTERGACGNERVGMSRHANTAFCWGWRVIARRWPYLLIMTAAGDERGKNVLRWLNMILPAAVDKANIKTDSNSVLLMLIPDFPHAHQHIVHARIWLQSLTRPIIYALIHHDIVLIMMQLWPGSASSWKNYNVLVTFTSVNVRLIKRRHQSAGNDYLLHWQPDSSSIKWFPATCLANKRQQLTHHEESLPNTGRYEGTFHESKLYV